MLGDMGLIHMNGRVQDARTGRFLSPDPILQDPSNAQNFNRYSYVLNRPVTFTDPSGFCQIIQTRDTLLESYRYALYKDMVDAIREGNARKLQALETAA
jgi:RHS repeat-associated protein